MVHGHGAESVTLAWDANPEPDVIGYRVRFGTATGNYTETVDAGNATTATLPNLTAGTKYFIVATAYNAAGLESLPSAEITYTPIASQANQPPTVYLDSPTNGSQHSAPANIALSASANDSDGSIARVEFYQGTTKLGQNTNNPFTFTWTNVAPGTYSLSAIAFDNQGASTKSATVNVTVNASAPPAATGLSAASNSPSQIALTWAASVGATSYTIKRSTTNGGPYSPVATGLTSASYSDSNLLPSTTYYYVVSAVNTAGESPNSTQASATTKAAVSNQPPTVQLNSPVNGSQHSAPANIVLSASANDSDGSIARVEFYQGTTKLGQNTNNPFTFTWTNVAPGTYTLSAIAFDNQGASTKSATVNVTVNASAPPAATGLSATSDSTNQITLTWTASNGATSYNVKRSTTSGGPYSPVATGMTTTSFADTGLSPSTSYYYVVTAVNSAGDSPNSAQAKATTKGLANQPPTVQLDSPANGSQYIAPTNVMLRASANDSDGSIARVEFYQGGTRLGQTSTSPYSLTWTISAPGTYSLSAIAFDNQGASTQSVAINISVNASAPPDAPVLTATTISTSEIAVDLAPSTDATSYIIKRSKKKRGGYVTIATSDVPMSFADSGLAPSTKYFYKVKAVNAAGKSPASEPISATTQALPFVPDVPEELSARAGDKQVFLAWNASKGATAYNIKRSTNSAGPYATIATDLAMPIFTDTGLKNGTTYYYVASAVGSGGESANSNPVNATPQVPLPSPWVNRDIGPVDMAGSAIYSNGTFTINGSGATIGGKADEFHYAFETANEDCEIVAHINSIEGAGPNATAGIMIRETTAKGSVNSSVLLNPSGIAYFQQRTLTGGGSSITATSAVALPCWLKLARIGNKVVANYSANGTDWTQIGQIQKVRMASTVMIGLVSSSGVDGTLSTSTMDSVTATP